MRGFILYRLEDESGVSGTGIVAEGVQFSNGWCALAWLTEIKSMGFYPNIEAVQKIHGHEGKTQVRWKHMTKDDNQMLSDRIDLEGFEYALVFYSDWRQIKDPEFHKFRKAFLQARANLINYIGTEE